MKLYLSTGEVKRLTISNGGNGKGSSSSSVIRRCSSRRNCFAVVILLGILLPFLFVRVALSVLESASVCDSPLDCIGWSFFDKGDSSSLKLGEKLTRALVEARDGNYEGGSEDSLESFNQLVKEMTSKPQDLKAFAFKTKSMLSRMEHKLQTARQHEMVYWHLASHGIPKSLNCLSLKLAEEYAVNSMARSRLPPPDYVSRLTDPSFHHIVLLTDNVLAASVVISTTVQTATNPEKLVFHVVTDKKTYIPMHAWFATNSIALAVVEVKGLHQFDWSQEINIGVKEMLEIHRLVWNNHYKRLQEKDFECQGKHTRCLESLSLNSLSLMNHLRIYIYELFPDLNKIVFLDDDVVVQHDISSLWDIDLNGKVVGAVVDSWCGENCCPGRRYDNYLNFSHTIISANFDHDRCAWLSGMNVFDLEAWRKSNITSTYHRWLKHSLHLGLQLWQPGVFPPSLLAFKGQVHPLDPIWHVAGLGYRFQETSEEILEAAAVLHFSGPAKPWLEIGIPEVRNLWRRHINCSNTFIRKCGVMR